MSNTCHLCQHAMKLCASAQLQCDATQPARLTGPEVLLAVFLFRLHLSASHNITQTKHTA
jgi:hypothetical protein